MKKLLIFVTFFFFAALSTFADEQRKIKLDDGHTKEQVRFGSCNVFVTRGDMDNDGNAKVTVEIENLDDSIVMILFDHAYLEKVLKKQSTPITFDKNFPGTKGQRNIETYKEARNVLFIEPSGTIKLPEIFVRSAEIQLCRLPLYIAKYENKKFLGIKLKTKKIVLLERQILELEIEVEDKDFLRLEKDCNDLIEDISKQTFCTNSRHRPSLESQQAPFKEKIGTIKSEIDEVISRRFWNPNGKGYMRYNEIKQKLDAIDFSKYEGDCGNPKNHRINPQRRHTCKYCNLSLQQIYHKLDDYYKRIYSSNNRKAAKDAIITDVNLLYRCFTDSNRTKHSPRNNNEYKSKITYLYNRINNF